MTKHFVAACFAVAAAITAPAQTLFTYGTDSVSVKEFLQAFQKNNTGENSTEAQKQYLQLYIASRLKIKEARERGYHTLPHMQAELTALREQIMPAYLNDAESVEELVKEAAQRAQKDIELSHIFISFLQDGLTDEKAAKQKADEALAQLKQGQPFADVARRFSNDPSAQTNGGRIGYISAFTLPYELENSVYNTPVGSISNYRSKAGYHIFKINGERPARGRMRIAQILLALPPDADAATEAVLQKRADSVYNRLLKGDDFGLLAAKLSDDAVSAQTGGQLPEISIGQYDALFENIVFDLPNDGAISQPFKTAHGYHIVKRLARLPFTGDEKDKEWLRRKVEASEGHLQVVQHKLMQKILQTSPSTFHNYSKPELKAYMDSVLDGKRETRRFTLTAATPLFSINNTTATVNDFIEFAQVHRFKNDGSGIKPFEEVWDAFTASVTLEHYKQNLETFNPLFRQQLQEFEEGSLFFEIMQREVWNKAQEDTAALQAFYNAHKPQYVWQKSADAILVYAQDEATAKSLQTAIAKAPKAWRKLFDNNNSGAVADSGRFELEQLPGKATGALKAGSTTQPLLNSSDGSYAFAYIVKIYNAAAQRTFAEARSQVMTDYQAHLEKQWVESLKRKYGVVVREEALQEVLKSASADR